VVAVVFGAQQTPQLVVEPGRAGLVTCAGSHCILIVHPSSIGTRTEFFEAEM
jgi:hypothetical protein